MATVQTRLAALSKAHELFIAANAHLNLGPEVNPLRDPRVRQLGKRDRTLLLFGWASGGRRRSEITAATFENVRRDGDGFVYHLGRSKTNQGTRKDPKNLKPIQGAAAAALEAWMKALLEFRITHGPIFRSILNDRIAEPLRDGAAREIIRHRAEWPISPWENSRRTRCDRDSSARPVSRASRLLDIDD